MISVWGPSLVLSERNECESMNLGASYESQLRQLAAHRQNYVRLRHVAPRVVAFLLPFDSRFLDHLRPLLDVHHHARAHSLGRAAARLHSEPPSLRPKVRI